MSVPAAPKCESVAGEHALESQCGALASRMSQPSPQSATSQV